MMKKIILLFVLVLSCSLLSSCGSVNSASKMIQKSLSSMTKVETNMVMNDADVLVYQYTRTVEIDSSNTASITSYTKELNSSFNYQEETTTESVKDFTRKNLVSLNLKNKYFNKITSSKTNVYATFSSKQTSNIFGSNIDINGEGSLELSFENGKIVKMILKYQTASLKDVVVETTFSY
jgi:predicted small secreted protein